MKRWLPISIAAVLAMGTIAGCGDSNDHTPNTVNSGNVSNMETSSEPASDKADLSKKLDIDILTISYGGANWSNDSAIAQFLSKKFNVNLNFQAISQDNYEEKLNVLAAAGNFPDAFLVQKDDFLKWRDKGVFLDLAPVIDQYPNLTQYLGGKESLQFMNPSGKIYGLPYYQIETQTSFGIRKDWLDKLGLQMPTTIDEFYEVTKAFATQDPDGDGKADTYGFSASLVQNKTDFKHIDPIKAAFGLVNNWGVKDGQLISWHTQTQELKDFATFLNKAYKEGVLDKDFAINKVKDPQDKYESAGEVGIDDVVPNSFYQSIVPKLKKIEPNAETVQLLPPKGPTGLQGTSTNSITQKVVINAKIDKDKQTRLLDMFNYFLSDEGDILTKNGVEGVDYKKDGDKYTKLDAFDQDGANQISTLLLRRFDLHTQIHLWDDPTTVNNVDQWFKNSEPFKWADAAAGLESPTATKLGTTIDQKFISTLTKVIMGDQPISDIDQAVTQWKKDGGDQITKEYNDAYQAAQK